ncbi:hypothetical protein U1839_25885 [Sphingomonas sp. RT2P30]|uniref:hypothetical protein n=1 Tax=Parasphingomonas halimpatiens TaxID=3096162 RepID=UPI002FCBF40F
MDREIAERLMSAALALDQALGGIDTVISSMPAGPERKAFARALGDVFFLVNEGFIRPLAREYPELDLEA